MKRTNAPPIPEGLRIVLNGKQEWKDVMQVFEDAGWRWLSGKKPFDRNTCEYESIETGKDKKIAYCIGRPIDTVMTAAQFLQQYQGTIEYEVGDWVVITGGYSNMYNGQLYQIKGYDGAHWWVKTKDYNQCFLDKTRIRPATPEEIASVTKVVPKDPDVYIWDGDVLPDEYWVENPWFGKDKTEFVSLFNGMRKGNNVGGASRWYRVKDSKYQESTDWVSSNTDLPIVPYKLWKSILEQPDPQAEPVIERMFKKGDRIKVVRGSYEGCLGVIADVGLGSIYLANLDSGDKYVVLFSGETGTNVDIVHYKDEPAVSVMEKPQYHIDNVKGRRIAINCTTKELYTTVVELCDRTTNGKMMRSKTKGWEDYNEKVCVDISSYPGYADIDWCESASYKIITAEEFLRDNGIVLPAVSKWSIVTTDGVRVYEGGEIWWIKPDGQTYSFSCTGGRSTKLLKVNEEDIRKGYIPFSTFEAAEEYISKQKQPAGRKWKVGEKYCIPGDNSGGWYIREYTKALYKVETSEGLKDYKYEAREIDDYVNSGHWIRDHRGWAKTSKEKNDNQTNNQTKNNDKNNQQPQQDSCISNSNNQSSRYSVTALDLRTDQETISTGSRSTGTSLRCTGQPELFAVQHSSYPKGSGYCEEV